MRSRFVQLSLAAFALALTACEAAMPTPFALSWNFSDGRDCTNAGVSTVVIVVDDAKERIECPRGFPPASNTLNVRPADFAVRVEALSFDNNVLYRGEMNYDVTPTFSTVTLYPDRAR